MRRVLQDALLAAADLAELAANTIVVTSVAVWVVKKHVNLDIKKVESNV